MKIYKIIKINRALYNSTDFSTEVPDVFYRKIATLKRYLQIFQIDCQMHSKQIHIKILKSCMRFKEFYVKTLNGDF